MSCTANEITFNMSASVSVELLCTSFLGNESSGMPKNITSSVVSINLEFFPFFLSNQKETKTPVLSTSLLSFFKIML